jgi:hypothetical protein
MAVKDRRSGGRNWVPGLFAAFWILLAVFSAAYLFRIVTEPRSQTADSAAANPATSPEPATPSPTASSLSADQAQSLIQANEAKDKEIGTLRAEVQSLSGQVTELSNRLKPLEKVLGPVSKPGRRSRLPRRRMTPVPRQSLRRPPAIRARATRRQARSPPTSHHLNRRRPQISRRRRPCRQFRQAPPASASKSAASASRMMSGRCGRIS